MDKYSVTGMSCAACSARVEKAVSTVDGVTSCSVNLLTNSMTVEGTASAEVIISAVEKAGYGAKLSSDTSENKTADKEKLPDSETGKLLKRFLFSLGFLLVLMYITMGHNMFSLPLPSFLSENCMALALTELLLAAVVMVINQKFFINGFKGLVRLAPNMDTLVSIGSGAAFVYSTFVTFRISAAVMNQDISLATKYLHDLYFESAAMILALITLGKMLESYSKGKTTNALKSLMELAPDTATVIRDGVETIIPASQVQKNDVFVVRPGERFAVDGIITEGETTADESSLTGESMPVDKTVNSKVSASTVNLSGFVVCRATEVGEDTSFSKIIKMVSDAAATKAPIAKAADKVSGVFVPVVIAIAVVTGTLWLIFGSTVGFAVARAISVLVISCPCALGLATPVAIMVSSGVGAKNGILFKTAAALEYTGKIKTVVFDKTGTVTKGSPAITDIISASEDLLPCAYSLEQKSEHPLAKAVVSYAKQKAIEPFGTEEFQTVAGKGITAKINDELIVGGNYKFVSDYIKIPEEYTVKAENFTAEGKTILWFARGTEFLGFIAVADTIKEESAKAISTLHKMGIRTVMLTGDNPKTAAAIADKAGIDEVIAGVLPDGKAQAIEKLRSQGRVAMVGDGINDAPALTTADIGVAIGAGTDVAIDAADVVLVNSKLSDVPAAIALGRKTLRNIRENLFWAFFYNSIGIPLAAGAFINLLGWEMNPMFGAAAMSLSSFCVVTNALRLNFVNLKNKPKKEKIKMEKIFKVEGMMCPHCEAHVKTALEKISGVEKAEPSHKDGIVKVTFSAEVDDAVIKNEITAAGYKVL